MDTCSEQFSGAKYCSRKVSGLEEMRGRQGQEQNPDFEGFYLNEAPEKDKPYNLFTHLTSAKFETDAKYTALRNSLNDILDGTHKGLYTTHAELDAMVE